MCAHKSFDVASQPTLLFDGLHEAFCKWEFLVCRWPRCLKDKPIYRFITTRAIHHRLPKTGSHAQEVSCVTNGCRVHPHAHATCLQLPVAAAARTRRLPHLVLRHDITAPYELDWQVVCLFSSLRRSPFPVLPLF